MRWVKRSRAFRPWAFRTWALAGSGGGVVAPDVLTARVDLIGPSAQRFTLDGESGERLTARGPSGMRIDLEGTR